MDPDNKTLSTIIIDALRARNMTVEKLAQITGISDRFLDDLLENRFDRLPAYPYVRGYLTKIATILNLDSAKLWDDYTRYIRDIKRSGDHDRLPSNRFASAALDKKIIAGIVITLFVFGFIGFKLYYFFSPPQFIVDIADNMTTKEPYITARGSFNPNNRLTLGGEEIYADDNGHFEKTLTLYPGFNTLTFKIKKFLGKEYTITKQVFYEVATTTDVISSE